MKYAQFTKPLTVALPPDVYDVLKEKSEAKRISMAELVRDILSESVLLSAYDESQGKTKQNREEKTNEVNK